MVQFNILSGKMAGQQIAARHFPFCIGRSATADLPLPEDGVWDRHLELSLDPATGFVLTASPDALMALNGGQPVQQAVLRNGDIIEIGALKLRFWLGAVRQYGLPFRELLVWLAFVAITAAQLALIYRLLP